MVTENDSVIVCKMERLLLHGEFKPVTVLRDIQESTCSKA